MAVKSLSYARWCLALINEWSVPLLLGIAIGSALSLWQLGELAELMDQVFFDALGRVVLACAEPQ